MATNDEDTSVDTTEETENPNLDTVEDGTVIINGKPKKFNKKMSAYMIDMLTSEE